MVVQNNDTIIGILTRFVPIIEAKGEFVRRFGTDYADDRERRRAAEDNAMRELTKRLNSLEKQQPDA